MGADEGHNRGNLLTEPLITDLAGEIRTLPGVLAALARDEVEGFAALRPHQQMFWHMFLVQLAALALHGADRHDIPAAEDEWRQLLRALTPDHPHDEPWTLLVANWQQPAFLQAAVAAGCKLDKQATTPDELDLLITSKNHDLKQMMAWNARLEHWLFALVSLQTGEGYGGRGNQGIARMNGGSSSRPMIALAPLPAGNPHLQQPRAGAWFRRDVEILLATRDREQHDGLDYPDQGGLGLVWLAPWPEGAQLRTSELDRWFIEICRRVRLRQDAAGRIVAGKGISEATRIDAKHLKGAVGDPWAPIHRTEGKSFTLAAGNFDYRTLKDLLLSGEWSLPVLARPQTTDAPAQNFTIVAQALARGNSRTDGFKSRLIPISGRAATRLGGSDPQLWNLARAQTEIIADFGKFLRNALALAAAGGDSEKRQREHYAFAGTASDALTRFADGIFFPHLWASLEDSGADHEGAFIDALRAAVVHIFETALPAIPVASLVRPRAEARARRALHGAIHHKYGAERKEKPDAA